MPNWEDGDGGCGCPSGHDAGLGWHHAGQHGCISGPKDSVGVSDVERRRRAIDTYVAGVPGDERETRIARLSFAAGWDAASGGAVKWEAP